MRSCENPCLYGGMKRQLIPVCGRDHAFRLRGRSLAYVCVAKPVPSTDGAVRSSAGRPLHGFRRPAKSGDSFSSAAARVNARKYGVPPSGGQTVAWTSGLANAGAMSEAGGWPAEAGTPNLELERSAGKEPVKRSNSSRNSRRSDALLSERVLQNVKNYRRAGWPDGEKRRNSSRNSRRHNALLSESALQNVTPHLAVRLDCRSLSFEGIALCDLCVSAFQSRSL